MLSAETASNKDLEDLKIMRERGFSEAALEDILVRAEVGESPLEALARYFNVMYKPKVLSLRSLLARLTRAELRGIYLKDQISAARRKEGRSREVA